MRIGKLSLKPPANPLSAVVALGKQLSTLHDPLDQLLAYCHAVHGISPSLDGVYLAFFSGAGLLPVRLFHFEAATARLCFLRTSDLTAREKTLFREFSKALREKGKGKSADRDGAEERELVEVLFKKGPQAEGRDHARESAEGAGKPRRRRLEFVESLPLRSRSGRAAGWILLAAQQGEKGVGKGEDRNAVSVCTDILSASLDRAGLFARVLRAKKEWERSVDAIRDVVMIVAPDYTVVRGNQRLAELAGVPVEALRDARCHDLLASLKKPCPHCPVKDTFEKAVGRTAEIHRQGGHSVFEVSSYPILDAGGRPDAVAVYEKNVTTYKQMQAKLVQAEKMAVLGELAAAVAHELNNPLSGVISFSKILLGEMDPGQPHVEDVRNIEHAALRCKKIVQDLLVFSRKPETVRHAPVDLVSILEQVQTMLRPRLEEAGIELVCVVPAAVPALPFHPDLLHQILMNLITNAMDASVSGGESGNSCRPAPKRGASLSRDRGEGPGGRYPG